MKEEVKLTPKQRRFVEEYCVDFNATQAAIRAGYSERTAYSIGSENLIKPEISEAIENRLESLDLTAAQTSKLMSDIAQSSMNDYFVVVEKERIKYVKKPLRELIDRKQREIEAAYMFVERKGFADKERDDYIEKNIMVLEDDLLKHEIELELNPDATFDDPEIEIYEDVELDLVKLTRDKERGRIKSFEMKDTGPKVELYAADRMLVNIANKLGFFTNRHQMLDKDGDPTDPTPDPLAPVQFNINVIERSVNGDIQSTSEEGTVQQEANNT